MVWSPNHGDTAFTVPMFDKFMKRVMVTLTAHSTNAVKRPVPGDQLHADTAE
jgi:hypothetical protein